MTTAKWIDRPGGVRLPYVVHGPGRGPRLVFAHSMLTSGTGAGDVFTPFVERGWTVAAPDQRGHGLAEGSWGQDDFRLDVLGGDLVALLDDLGWERAWLGGGSMGAATAMAAAIAAPARVEGLLLAAPAIGAESNGGLAVFSPVADAFDRGGMDAGVAAWAAAFGSLQEPHDAALRALGPGGAAALLRAVAGWSFGTWPSFDVEVLTSSWEGDPVHPAATARAIAEASPRGRHLALPGSGPDLFVRLAAQLP